MRNPGRLLYVYGRELCGKGRLAYVYRPLLSPGFSLIELLLVLTLAATIAGALFSVFYQQSARKESIVFVERLNALVRLAWQQTMMTNKVHRVCFDIGQRRAFIERSKTSTVNLAGTNTFEPTGGALVSSSLRWSDRFTIRQFLIDGQDEINKASEGGRRKVTELYFYIVPGGIAQRVIINVVEQRGKEKKQIGLVLNPFNAQFKRYDTFQK